MNPVPAGILGGVLAAAVASLSAALLLHRRARLPLDAPNTRSLHEEPVPRIGGLVIWAGFVPVALLSRAELPGNAVWWVGWLAVLLVSLQDDRRGVPPLARLAVQGAAAGVAAWAMLAGRAVAPWPAAMVMAGAVLAIVWSANAFNFMDGSDGLAAIMTLFGFSAYAAGAMRGGSDAAAYWALVAATLPFAVINWPPARMFMGDNGAVPLGFLAAAFGVGEWARGTWPGWFPLLAFLPFLADATLTLIGRALRRERVWEAHRGHYYQRLHRLGAGHRGTLCLYGLLMAGTAASAVVTLRIEPNAGWLVLTAWCLALWLVFLCIDYHWRRRSLTSA